MSRLRVSVAMAALIVGATIGVASPAAAVTATPFCTNLVRNPCAELGVGGENVAEDHCDAYFDNIVVKIVHV